MRIVKEIEIEGKKAMALFHTGSMHTYVVNQLLEGVPIRRLSEPYRVALGGRIVEVKEYGLAACAPLSSIREDHTPCLVCYASYSRQTHSNILSSSGLSTYPS